MIVADVNLITYLLIAGPFSDSAQRAFDKDGMWIVPALWQHELLNILATSVRNNHMSLVKAQDVWAHAPAFVRDADVSALDVLDLASSTKFATYDCYYVVLARKMYVPLVTADKKLIEAFPDVAVSIQGFVERKT